MEKVHEVGQGFRLIVQGQPPLALKVGEVVEGEVVGLSADNTVSIRVKDTLFHAKSDLSLRKGSKALFQVEVTADGPIHLKMVDKPPAASVDTVRATLSSALRNMTPLAAPSAEWAELAVLIQRLSISGSLPTVFSLFFSRVSTLTGAALQEMFLASGSFFEAKLAALIQKADISGTVTPDVGQTIATDLKGMLLSLKATLQDTKMMPHLTQTGVNRSDLAARVDRLIGQIEYHQMQSQLGQALQVFIPFSWEGLQESTVKFQERYVGVPSRPECTVTLCLQMERIGKTVSTIRLFANRLHVQFLTENPSFHRLLQRSAHLLEKQLTAVGLIPGGISSRYEPNLAFDRLPPMGVNLNA